MPRTMTSRQLSAYTARARRGVWRVYVDDLGGSPVDWTEWVEVWEVFEDQEEFTLGADITFARQHAGTSLSPFIGSDKPIHIGRSVEIQVALVELGDAVEVDDWEVIFRGKIDDQEWGGDANEMVVPCRGPGRALLKGFIRAEVEYGNDTATQPAETVMQSISDAVFGAGAIPMDVEGDPDFGLRTYTQQRESVRAAHEAILDKFGWVARYRWHEGYADWRYTLYQPDRDKTTPDFTFGPGDYMDVEQLAISTADLRTEVEVLYTTGVDSVVVIDSDAIAEFGGGEADYFFLDVTDDAQIDNLEKATALAVAILSDLSQPRAVQRTKNAVFPWVELGDLYRWEPNGVHYDAAQDMAVTAYRHRGSKEELVTFLDVRGKPSGGASRWFRRKQEADRDKAIRRITGTEPSGADNMQYRYTTRYAVVGNAEESEQAESLGGWISTTVVSQSLAGAFRDITEDEREYGTTLYRAFALVNVDSSPSPQTFECPVGWLPDDDTDGVDWAMALDPTGVVPINSPYEQGLIIGDELDEPLTSPAFTWVTPLTWDAVDAVEPEDVPAQYGFIFWVRLIIQPGTEGDIYSDFVIFGNRVPQDGSP